MDRDLKYIFNMRPENDVLIIKQQSNQIVAIMTIVFFS